MCRSKVSGETIVSSEIETQWQLKIFRIRKIR